MELQEGSYYKIQRTPILPKDIVIWNEIKMSKMKGILLGVFVY